MGFSEKELIEFGNRLIENISEQNKAEAELQGRMAHQTPYYVAELPEDMQKEIRQRVAAVLTERGVFTPENLENAMKSKICDLEELFDAREYIQRLEEEQQKKAVEQRKGGRR